MYKKYIKRILDFLIALVATPLVLIIIAAMAPIIYMNDPGPVFYIANRRGMNGKTFKMVKFRSMYVNSPDIRNADGSTFNSENDPRVTKTGRFMRKTSLDELPQTLNVLIGDMSFIGPRPALSTRPYEELSELSKARLAVRPGITGYAQAYYRNAISQDEKFKYDYYYINHMSFWFDVRILIQTVCIVLSHKNIYVSSEQAISETEKSEVAMK